MRLTTRRLRHLGRSLPTGIAGTTTIDLAIAGAAVGIALGLAVAFDRILTGHGAVAPIVGLIGAATIARWGLSGARRRRVGRTADATAGALRRQLYLQLSRLGPGYLVRHRTGQLESAFTDGVDGLGGYYADLVPRYLATTVTASAVIAGLVAIDPVVGAIVVVAAAVVVLAPVLSARAFGSTTGRFAETIGATAAEYLDAIQGIATLQAFGATDVWRRRLHDQYRELAEDETALAAMANMHLGFTTLGLSAGTAVAVAVAVSQATHHHLGAGALLAVLVLSADALGALGALAASLPAAYRATAVAGPVLAILEAEPETTDPARPQTIGDRAFRGDVVFDHVSFHYEPDRAALSDVSFSVERGQMLAIVGPSGAGKSTLVSLLLRFFDPDAGHIRVGGHDITTLALTDLRRLISVTFQDTYLFNRSVRHNLLLGRPDATESQMRAAARAADAADLIDALPDGYDTVLGERGTRLSGGQRQRLAIARALLSPAPILVFDEPTSSVDEASEASITDALARLRVDRTVIVIAHRRSTIVGADRLVVIDGGRVVESGPYRVEADRPGDAPADALVADGST